MNTVLVIWTAPSPPPTDGYQVQITRGSTTTTVNVAGTSHTFSVNNQSGVYSTQVRSLSPHFQSNEAAPEPVEASVGGINQLPEYRSMHCMFLLFAQLIKGQSEKMTQRVCITQKKSQYVVQ